MTTDDWQLIESIVQAAFDKPPDERIGYLSEACAGRPDIWQEVSSLLEADGESETLIDAPPKLRAPDDWAPESTWSGDQLGPYRLEQEIGFGAWSRVYRARREDFEQQVAVKVVDPMARPAGEDVAQRFRIERQILAGLEHRSIARLLDGGEVAGRLYFVMEYVEGQPIDEHAKTLSLDHRLRLMLDVCDAVAHAHERLIVHRDLKPSNILVTPDGVPKLLDFGIAKVLEPSTLPLDIEMTRTGLRPMTLAWAAPEQVRGGAITTATDVYGLGLLLYALVTGARAFDLDGLGRCRSRRSFATSSQLGQVVVSTKSASKRLMPTRPSHRHNSRAISTPSS